MDRALLVDGGITPKIKGMFPEEESIPSPQRYIPFLMLEDRRIIDFGCLFFDLGACILALLS